MTGAFLTSSISGEGILGNVTSFVSEATTWIASFADAVVNNDLLLLGVVIMPIAGFGIGAIKRLLSTRA